MEFSGSKNYISTNDLTVAVNASIALEKPLLVKGEPGTGKTELARQIASSLKLEIIEWSIKSTTKAQQGLYEYDAVSRLRDSQLGEEIKDISKYIKKGKIWESFETTKKSVLLIDEIDKADIEFPNDLLQELDKMEFYIYETGEVIKANHRPIIIITSNNEKELTSAIDKAEEEVNTESIVKTPFENYFNRLYFSIVTGCLLGYGDIYPESIRLKALVTVQALLTIIIIVM